jgi:hypothetical protein
MWALETHSGCTRRSTSHAEPSKAPPRVTGAVATSPMTRIQCAAWFQKSLDSCEWTGWSCRSSLTQWRLHKTSSSCLCREERWLYNPPKESAMGVAPGRGDREQRSRVRRDAKTRRVKMNVSVGWYRRETIAHQMRHGKTGFFFAR